MNFLMIATSSLALLVAATTAHAHAREFTGNLERLESPVFNRELRATIPNDPATLFPRQSLNLTRFILGNLTFRDDILSTIFATSTIIASPSTEVVAKTILSTSVSSDTATILSISTLFAVPSTSVIGTTVIETNFVLSTSTVSFVQPESIVLGSASPVAASSPFSISPSFSQESTSRTTVLTTSLSQSISTDASYTTATLFPPTLLRTVTTGISGSDASSPPEVVSTKTTTALGSSLIYTFTQLSLSLTVSTTTQTVSPNSNYGHPDPITTPTISAVGSPQDGTPGCVCPAPVTITMTQTLIAATETLSPIPLPSNQSPNTLPLPAIESGHTYSASTETTPGSAATTTRPTTTPAMRSIGDPFISSTTISGTAESSSESIVIPISITPSLSSLYTFPPGLPTSLIGQGMSRKPATVSASKMAPYPFNATTAIAASGKTTGPTAQSSVQMFTGAVDGGSQASFKLAFLIGFLALVLLV